MDTFNIKLTAAMRHPSVRKAPAGKAKKSIGLKPGRVMPSTEPAPRTSLKRPRMLRAKVKPIPINNPSTIETTGPFLEANASALARIIQFTTIKGINKPRDLSRLGKYALISSSTAVTKPEIITMYAAILTCFGINFLRREIRRFDNTRTAVAERPMPRPLIRVVEVARVGQVPRS